MKHQEDLAARLTRFYREAKLEVPASPPAWNPPQRRSRPTWQPVLASAGLAVLALSLFFAVRLARDQATQARVKASPSVQTSTQPSAAPTSTPSPGPSPDASWVTKRFSIGPVSALLLDPAGVFALYVPGPINGRTNPAQIKIGRVDRTSGVITAGETIPNASGLARVSAGLWVAAGPVQASGAPSGRSLTLVDPSTLAVKRQATLPGQPGSDVAAGPQIAGNSSMLWLAYGSNAYRLNPDTGLVLSTRALPGVATSLALDPLGTRLYVGIEVPSVSTGQDRVIELDASTGALLASAETGGRGLGGPRLAAASDGVWISYATGMMGAVEHRLAANLSPTGSAVRTSNSITAVVGAGALWLIDGMAQQLTCADTSTGVTRAATAESQPTGFAVDASGAYLGDFQGVAHLQPPASCRG